MKPLLVEKSDEDAVVYEQRRFWAFGTAARICLALAISAVLLVLYLRPLELNISWDRTIRTAWGLEDETPVRTHLAGPMEGHYLTTVQAAITSQAETYKHTLGPKSDHFVNVLAITGEIDPPPRPEVWQVFVRNATNLIGIECTLSSTLLGSFSGSGTIRIPWMYDLEGPASGAALLLQCPIPLRWESYMGIGAGAGLLPEMSDLRVDIALQMAGSAPPQNLPTISLKTYHPPPTTTVGMCVAPIYGEWSGQKLVDWREHHKLLGFNPVHWYARDASISTFFHHYPTFNSGSDNFRHSPVLHPEVYNTSKLANSGFYSDQVLYAMDCMLRSRYRAPSKWLAFYDLDEYFLPEALGSRQSMWPKHVENYLAGLPEYASVSIGRVHASDNAHLQIQDLRTTSNDYAPRIASLNIVRPPKKDDPPGNHKHMHRLDAVEATAVHAPTALFPGWIYRPPLVPSPMQLLHMGTSIFSTGPYRYFRKAANLDKFLQAVTKATKRNLAVLEKSGVQLGGS